MWTAILGNTLIYSYDRWGSTWAWRLVRLLHALPFLAGAFAMGWVIGYVFDAVPPMVAACAEAGLVATGMSISWFREWRAYRRSY